MRSYLALRTRHLTRILLSLALLACLSISGSIFTLSSAHAQTAGDVSYQYDELGRLIQVSYSNGTIVDYDYDAAGNRKTVFALTGVGDSVPLIGEGANLIDLSGWPVGDAPAGGAAVSGWVASSSYTNEARWVRVTGPGQSGTITAMEVGQTEPDPNGGGSAYVNWFDIDPTKAYEYTIYFRKHDLSVQNVYFGPHRYYSAGTEYMSYAYGAGAPTNNPYSMSWDLSTQATYLVPTKWYKVVGYVLPEGHSLVNNAEWGGVYDVATGTKVANVRVFRWNPDRPDNKGQVRFFTYYSEATQGVYTTYFYRPEARPVDCNLRPELCNYQYVVPTISTSHADAAEGSDITFTVSLSEATTVPVQVDYVVDHDGDPDSAEADDYTAVSGTLTIAESAMSGTITVSTINNGTYEGDEAVRLTVSNPLRATIVAGQDVEEALILDTADAISFSVNDVSVTEGGNLVFTVTKSGTTAVSHSISRATADGTAVAGSDYTAKSLAVWTFAPGEATKSISVTTNGDETYENNETVLLELSSPTSGAIITDDQGVGTINNDDTAPSFSINDVSQPEGTDIVFTVSKSVSSELSHTVDFATGNVTAGASDYNANSGTLTFAPTDSTLPITVSTISDDNYEYSESFEVDLTQPTGEVATVDALLGTGTGTVANEDAPPSFSVNDVSVTEGGNLSFTVTKTGGTRLTHKVNYATANGTATAGSDFTAISSTQLSFAADTYTIPVTVVTTDDSTYEGDEALYINLSGATNSATISDAQGLGTINDDESPPNLPPSAVNDSGSLGQWDTGIYAVLVNDSDPEGDTLSITSLVNPGGLTVIGSIACGGTCIQADSFGNSGTYSITYTISDGNGNTDSALLTITVTGGGGPPL